MPETILVVDDSRSLRTMLEDTFRGAGYGVISAGNGREALSLLATHPADLIVTDFMMPLMNGVELTRAVRATPGGQSIPILLLSTESEPEKKQAAREAGASGWAVKPFDPAQLLQTVAALLRKRHPAS